MDRQTHSSISKQRTEHEQAVAAAGLPGSLRRIRVRCQRGERFSLATSFGSSNTQPHGVKSLTRQKERRFLHADPKETIKNFELTASRHSLKSATAMDDAAVSAA